jgi:hypothetical protein
VYEGELYAVTVTSTGATVSTTPLSSGGSGADGITPHIGANGNWWIGEEDTGVSAGVTDEQISGAVEEYMEDNPLVKTVNGTAPDENGNVELEIQSGAIPAPETAEVGQTIVVKEVDENGKPTLWEAADFAADSQFELLADITTTEVVSAIETTVDGAYRELYVVITTAADENVSKWMDLQVNGGRVSEGTPNRNVLKNHVMYVRTLPEINGVYCISSFMNGGSAMGGDAIHSFVNGISYSDKISLRTSTYSNPGTTGNIFASGSGMKVWGRK